MATLLRRSALASLMAMALLLIAAPAFAHHKADHTGGPSSTSSSSSSNASSNSNSNANTSSTTTVVTEDNDDDGAVDYANTPDPAGDTDNMHPSGKDRSTENGGSGNQGKSGSDPDGTKNGGVDKPNGKGGNDLLDQDGNNGCGNDDDFEDDNNGNCGGKAKTKPPKTPKPPKQDNPKGNDTPKPPKNDDDDTPVVPSGNPTVTPPTVVSDASTTDQGDRNPRPRPAARGGAEAAPAVVVADGELAFTGMNVSMLLIVMSILGLLGAALILAGRRIRA